MRPVAIFAASLMIGNTALAATPSSEVARAVFDICPLILNGQLEINDAGSMSRHGYLAQAADREGQWSSIDLGNATIRISTSDGQPGCRVRYQGAASEATYEILLKDSTRRGFAFASGARKPAEAQFVLDTLISKDGPIGILSIFRVLGDDTGFAVTTFSPIARR